MRRAREGARIAGEATASVLRRRTWSIAEILPEVRVEVRGWLEPEVVDHHDAAEQHLEAQKEELEEVISLQM